MDLYKSIINTIKTMKENLNIEDGFVSNMLWLNKFEDLKDIEKDVMRALAELIRGSEYAQGVRIDGSMNVAYIHNSIHSNEFNIHFRYLPSASQALVTIKGDEPNYVATIGTEFPVGKVGKILSTEYTDSLILNAMAENLQDDGMTEDHSKEYVEEYHRLIGIFGDILDKEKFDKHFMSIEKSIYKRPTNVYEINGTDWSMTRESGTEFYLLERDGSKWITRSYLEIDNKCSGALFELYFKMHDHVETLSVYVYRPIFNVAGPLSVPPIPVKNYVVSKPIPHGTGDVGMEKFIKEIDK